MFLPYCSIRLSFIRIPDFYFKSWREYKWHSPALDSQAPCSKISGLPCSRLGLEYCFLIWLTPFSFKTGLQVTFPKQCPDHVGQHSPTHFSISLNLLCIFSWCFSYKQLYNSSMHCLTEFHCLRGEAFSLFWLLMNWRFFCESQVSRRILDA